VKEEKRIQDVFRDLYQATTGLAAQGTDTGNIWFQRLYVEHENQTAAKTYQSLGLTKIRYILFDQLKKEASFFS
jgi:ribosomal protein S18 acetylase RimI-like enzyme